MILFLREAEHKLKKRLKKRDGPDEDVFNKTGFDLPGLIEMNLICMTSIKTKN